MNPDKEYIKLGMMNLKIIGIILFFGLLISSYLYTVGLHLPNVNLSKKLLAEYYNINKRTLNRWIDCFLPIELQNQIHYKKSISPETLYQIINILGDPKGFPVINRKLIIVLGEGNYRQLQKLVNHHGAFENLPLDLLKSIRTFPPAFGKIVADGFGLHPSEIEDLL